MLVFFFLQINFDSNTPFLTNFFSLNPSKGVVVLSLILKNFSPVIFFREVMGF